MVIVTGAAHAGDHSFGVGVHYFYTLDEIGDELGDSVSSIFKDDGFAYNFSYRYKFNQRFGFLTEVQLYPDGYHDAKTVVSPRIFMLLGKSIYGGIGMGWNNVRWRDETKDLHVSGDWTDPFYMLRAGLEFSIFVEHLLLDIHADYEFNYWNDVKELDSDILTFGAGIRITI